MRLSRRSLLLGLGALPASARAGGVADEPGTADVIAYGARGDGVTDDGRAIQEAIDSGLPLLRFPPGRYLCRRPLVPRSGQAWRGDGAAVSVLLQPQTSPPPPFNLVERRGTLEEVSFNDLGFIGNGRRHTGSGGDGQRGFAVYVRGAQRGIAFQSCRFSGFGGGRGGGGGIAMGPLPHSTPQALEDITVAGCVFAGNANVPGIYLAAGGQAGARRHGIRLAGNRFAGVPAGTRPQNCIYVLADGAAARIANVVVADNVFDIADAVDACIELNWVDGFTIAGNIMTFAGAVRGSSGILLRDGCRGGSVTGNSLRDASGEQVVAIDLVNFADPGTIEDVAISGNTVLGFTWRGIAVDRGSRGVVVSGNRLSGGGRLLAEAVRLADAAEVLVSSNAVSDAVAPIVLAGGDGVAAGLRTVSITGNLFSRCGGDGPLITVQGTNCRARGLVVDGNRVALPRSGTTAFAGGGFAVADDNMMGANQTAGLPAVVAGEEGGWRPPPLR